MRRRTPVGVLAALLAATTFLITTAPPASAALTERWRREVPNTKFEWSSPVIADVDSNGSNDVVAAATNGVVYAYNANGGDMWQRNVGAPIASSPSVGDVDGDGFNEVVVGYGDVTTPAGGVAVINRDGSLRCKFETRKQFSNSAVFNSAALGDVDGNGTNDIVFGAFDQWIYVVNGSCGKIADFLQYDSVWSAPALRDVDADGQQEIFIGGDATAGLFAHSGGYYRSLEYNGTGTLRERWAPRLSAETFQSGSAFATIDGRLAVVTGAGADYCRNQNRDCAHSRKVFAFDPNTGADIPGWPRSTTFTTWMAGPSVGDIDGDGRDDVVVGSTNYVNNGQPGGSIEGGAVDAFLSSRGYALSWTFRTPGREEMTTPPVIADINGSGGPEVTVAWNGDVAVLDGRTGTRTAASGFASVAWVHKSAVAVGNLGGNWSVVTAGYDANNAKIGAYAIPTPTSLPWPMHQKNARRLGSDPTDPRPINCSQGYYLTGADGGIFAFGPQAPYYGSTGDIRLNAPIVGMTANQARSGYWFVATDGGIFTYGSSKFHGSTGDIRLNRPIVGMAARPQGDGYWLVASDGGIFNFGPGASFHGSLGGAPLNSPIVGMAPTPSGNGYWLVAADGGIFNYGDAGYYGSTGDIRLNQPIVGMAASPSGRGYWFVARDGGIFTFGPGAAFHGSTGDIRLNQPIVGMRATPSGRGYWFVATDGGIFSFGDAEFCGSMGNRRLNLPIVAMG